MSLIQKDKASIESVRKRRRLQSLDVTIVAQHREFVVAIEEDGCPYSIVIEHVPLDYIARAIFDS